MASKINCVYTEELRGGVVAWWLTPLTPNPEVGGFEPHSGRRVVSLANIFTQPTTPQKRTGNTQEAVAPSGNMTEKLFTGTLSIKETEPNRRTYGCKDIFCNYILLIFLGGVSCMPEALLFSIVVDKVLFKGADKKEMHFLDEFEFWTVWTIDIRVSCGKWSLHIFTVVFLLENYSLLGCSQVSDRCHLGYLFIVALPEPSI